VLNFVPMSTSNVSHETGQNIKPVVGIRRLKEPMVAPLKTRIFTVANQKGGVGKTTTAVNLAAALSMGGLKVLVIDLDPQGNASTAFGIDRVASEGIYEVLINDLPMANVVQKVANFPHLEIIAANSDLAGAEIQLVPTVAREFRLQSALQTFLTTKQNAGQRFDYVFIDCPPSLGLLTINALTAADEVLVPIQCEYYSLEGLSLLIETLTEVQKRLNPKITLSTIVLTMFDSRTRLASDVAENVRKHFPQQLINTPIPRAVRVSEAPSYGQTVMTYDASSPGAIAYMSVAREIANRGSAPINLRNETA
jgi:chromosome partitioning protein